MLRKIILSPSLSSFINSSLLLSITNPINNNNSLRLISLFSSGPLQNYKLVNMT